MNRNKKRRLAHEKYMSQQQDPEDKLIAAIVLGLRRKYGFSGAKCGKIIRGMRLVICDAVHNRGLNAPQIVLFCAKETGMKPSEIIRGKDAMEDINLAGAMMALYSNCGFRRKRLLDAMQAIVAVLEEHEETSGADLMEIMEREANLKVM